MESETPTQTNRGFSTKRIVVLSITCWLAIGAAIILLFSVSVSGYHDNAITVFLIGIILLLLVTLLFLNIRKYWKTPMDRGFSRNITLLGCGLVILTITSHPLSRSIHWSFMFLECMIIFALPTCILLLLVGYYLSYVAH